MLFVWSALLYEKINPSWHSWKVATMKTDINRLAGASKSRDIDLIDRDYSNISQLRLLGLLLASTIANPEVVRESEQIVRIITHF